MKVATDNIIAYFYRKADMNCVGANAVLSIGILVSANVSIASFVAGLINSIGGKINKLKPSPSFSIQTSVLY
ncbi:hypothetical protein ACSTII_00155, partial [Vibrio parahaemolyticus]